MSRRSLFFLRLVCCLAIAVAVFSVAGPQVLAAVDPQYRVEVSALPKTTTGPAKIRQIFAVIFGILGALCLLMVTIGGFRYVASEGDAQATARAKGTVVYALLGLLICVSAVAIVTFVLGRLD
ncbi:MAG TPA: pilin [Candidatus Saccharimonadales bacterium]|jgi:hypothetical protein